MCVILVTQNQANKLSFPCLSNSLMVPSQRESVLALEMHEKIIGRFTMPWFSQ